MSNSLHDEAETWPDDQDNGHPAGEMALSRKTKVAARARALAGMTLAVGTLVVTMTSGTSVSNQSIF